MAHIRLEQEMGYLLLTKGSLQVGRPSQPLAYYVGESDNVRQRLYKHTKSAQKRFQGTVNAAVVAGLKKGQKSSAKKAEASLIRALVEQVPLLPLSHACCSICTLLQSISRYFEVSNLMCMSAALTECGCAGLLCSQHQ